MAPGQPQQSLSAAITSEDELIETPGLELLEELGWKHANLMQEDPGPANATGRLSFRELVLPGRFRAALNKLNPLLPAEALQEAELAVTANRSAMLPVAANRDVYRLLREGVSVQVRQQDGSTKPERAAVIDWTQPAITIFSSAPRSGLRAICTSAARMQWASSTASRCC
jgi:type I restriction enzyme R subunit